MVVVADCLGSYSEQGPANVKSITVANKVRTGEAGRRVGQRLAL